MEQKTLSRWLKLAILIAGVCGLFVCAFVIPAYGLSVVSMYPEFSNRFWPWLTFLILTALPCFAALVIGCMIAADIGRDRSFSFENASRLKWISWLAAGDAGFFFIGNLLLLLIDMRHPGVMIFSLIVVFAGVAVAVAAAALSHLVRKAAALQEQSDLTI